MKRVPIALLGLLLFCIVAVAITPVQGCGHLIRVVEMTGGPEVPEGATCENAGMVYPDNPFRGWPVPGTGWGHVTAYYCDPTYYEMFGVTHWGIDISAPIGTPAVATADAVVVRAGYDGSTGMGFNVKICTDSGWCAVYMHLENVAVAVGDRVSPGTMVGWVDNTGFSTGSHLHYQINDPSGRPVDPAPTM